jgi:hypothetical protein
MAEEERGRYYLTVRWPMLHQRRQEWQHRPRRRRGRARSGEPPSRAPTTSTTKHGKGPFPYSRWRERRSKKGRARGGGARAAIGATTRWEVAGIGRIWWRRRRDVESGGGEEVGKRDTTSYPDTIESHLELAWTCQNPKVLGWSGVQCSGLMHIYLIFFYINNEK